MVSRIHVSEAKNSSIFFRVSLPLSGSTSAVMLIWNQRSRLRVPVIERLQGHDDGTQRLDLGACSLSTNRSAPRLGDAQLILKIPGVIGSYPRYRGHSAGWYSPCSRHSYQDLASAEGALQPAHRRRKFSPAAWQSDPTRIPPRQPHSF
jgi:hypothetical protein